MNVALAQPLQVPASSISSVPASSGSSFFLQRGQTRGLDEAANLEALLREIEDLSSGSPELLERALKTGCWYHVTPFRSAMIRSLELPAGARILEVGCGGGALTRYLGEQGFQVVALEMSADFAHCARLRCHDLPNVEIVNGFFEDIVDDQKFDFVVCIDPTFAESDSFDPGMQLLALCKKALKATGTLVLAVGNSLHAPGGAHVEPSRNAVRGSSAPLEALKRSLASVGFSHAEHYAAFPNHAAPHLLINVEQARFERASWIPILKDLYCASQDAVQLLEKWWRGVELEALSDKLAPGWMILAHAHTVHSVLWGQKAGVRFALRGSESSNELSPANGEGIQVCPLVIARESIIEGVLEASTPQMNSVGDYKESLLAADQKIEEISVKEEIVSTQLQDARDALMKAEDRHANEVLMEQEARRIRESELGLVLKQYHAVGAMCHDMREEGRKLKDMLDELRRRYVASEEWGVALSKRVADAEAELQQTKSSRTYRLVQKIRGFFSKKQSARDAASLSAVPDPESQKRRHQRAARA
jgi:SAM-dependent methyltransferase